MTLEHVAGGLMFPEGPLWRDGRLLFSDFHALRVQAVEPDGSVTTVCEVGGQPSGLGFDADGRMLVVSMLDRRLLRLDPEGLTEVADLTALTGGPCNDMVVDRAGRAWVGEFGYDYGAPVRTAGVVRVDPDGAATRVADGVHFPNGLVMTRGGTLVVAETLGQRLTAFDVGETARSARRGRGRRSPRSRPRGSPRRSRAARSRRTGSASMPRARSGSPTWRVARRCACSRAAR
jgi:sugar lactone lactonase YvrE